MKLLRCVVVFHSMDAEPPYPGQGHERPALLYSACDGWHDVYARWDSDGEFRGFYNWTGGLKYAKDNCLAWAVLPDYEEMTGHFRPLQECPQCIQDPCQCSAIYGTSEK